MADNPPTNPSTPARTPANHQEMRISVTPESALTRQISSFRLSESSAHERPADLGPDESPSSDGLRPTLARYTTSSSSGKWANRVPTGISSSDDQDEPQQPPTSQSTGTGFESTLSSVEVVSQRGGLITSVERFSELQEQASPTTTSTPACRLSRLEIARQALDAYRAEPRAEPVSPSTVPETLRTPQREAIRGNPFTLEKKYSQAEGSEEAESPSRYPYGAIRGTSQRLQSPKQKRIDQPEQYQAVPGALLLSREAPITENIPTQPVNITARRSSAPVIPGQLSLAFSPPRDTHQYRKYPVVPESPKIGTINALTMRKQAIRNSQVTGILTSPVSGRISLDEISESEPVAHFGTSPSSPHMSPSGSPSIGLGIRMPKGRAVSATFSEELKRYQEKERHKQRMDHLTNGTWQQGRFRPPWDELTIIEGQSTINESTGGTKQRGPTSSPGLKYPGLVSPGPRSINVGNRGSIDINKRGSIDISRPSLDLSRPSSEYGQSPPRCGSPRFDENEIPEEELSEGEEDALSDTNEFCALLPSGPPKSLHDKYLLEILAEHYFDTLQTHLATYIYEHYLAPPVEESDVQLVYPPRVATFFTLGQMFLSSHMFISALKTFKHATELDPFDIASQVQLGYVNFLLVRYEEAEVAYRQALAGFRGSPVVNYRVLGLDASVHKDDIIKSVIACRDHASGRGEQGVWGIASGKIYRVPEEKKRNLKRRKYFEAGKVVGRVVEVSRVGFGGKRESELPRDSRKEADGEDDSMGLKRMWTGGSMWSWANRGSPGMGTGRFGGADEDSVLRKSLEISERDDDGAKGSQKRDSKREKSKKRFSLDLLMSGFKK